MVGKTISHYKIIEKLGEGGMGVVYKAEDTKLERTVALKFLSLTSIGDEEKKRFKREAKAAASLNHPNIATVFAIDEADNQTFIAMEFIEGKSLHEIVGAQHAVPLPLDDALNYATQIAAGLQAAHEKGITHRDIKSANIMVTEKDQVKIMDFGLAKLANRSMMTQMGTILGTVAYMSPEQARGEAADHRADIWSLGVVLYEMISGQMPFKGDYEQAVIYSIQNEDPEPLTALRSGVPLALDGIIAKALAKDKSIRYQNVEELPADLKGVDSASLSPSRISTASRPIISEKKWQAWVPWAATSAFFVAFLALAIIHFRETPEEKQSVRFTIPLPERLTDMRAPNISPDGRLLAFMGTDSSTVTSIWLRPLESLESRPLQGTENVADLLCWSPDSRFILYTTTDAKLKKIKNTGGAGTTIMETPKAIFFSLGSWGKGGTILYSFFPKPDGIYQVPSTGGSPMLVTTVDTSAGERAHFSPVFLPDDKHFLYNVDYGAGKDAIFVGSLDSKERKLFLSNALLLSYVSPGYLWYVRDETLMAQPFDAKRWKLSGEAVPIVGEFGRGGRFRVAASETGVMVFQGLGATAS